MIRFSSALFLLLLAGSPLQAQEPLPEFIKDYKEQAKPFLTKYCVECHGPDRQKGDIRLDTLATMTPEADNINRWQQVLDKLNLEEMPPEDAKQPESDEVKKLMRYIISGSQLARKHMDSSGHGTVLRRLNKTQYKNTIRDLLLFDTSSFDPTTEFPDDEEKENFKTIGAALVTSDFLMVEQLRASKIILDKILVDLKKPATQTEVMKPPFGDVPFVVETLSGLAG